MTPLTIARFDGEDCQDVIDLILPIQRDEFGLSVTIADQPDLLTIPAFYQVDGGDFWVARADGRVIGSIALKAFGAEGAVRKMFVATPYRGRENGVATRLLTTLLTHARQRAMTAVTLGTNDRLHAAHRFYEKNGFLAIAAEHLPIGFPRMTVDNRFYRRVLA